MCKPDACIAQDVRIPEAQWAHKGGEHMEFGLAFFKNEILTQKC